jgi:lipopolysaccharide biosynthesis glycosyltransferase
MDKIRVIAATDNNYAQHLGVMLVSLLENTSTPSRIEIYVIDGGITSQVQELLNQCVSNYGCKIRFLTIQPEVYQKFKESPVASYATYFRIFIPALLDASVEKILYLDCDMVVKGDIAKLWEVDISQFYVGAVENPGMEYIGEYGTQLKRNLGMLGKSRYFNAGVLLMNLTKWREDGITEKVSDFLIQHFEKTVFADQDALNAVLKDGWLQLPYEWNQQTTFYEQRKRKTAGEDMLQAIRNPRIIHYIYSPKPWFYMNQHPLKKEYYRYLKLTPWKGFVPPDRVFKNILVKGVLKTFVGRGIRNYWNFLKANYEKDRAVIPEKVSNSVLFKVGYFFLFPLGNLYLRMMARPVAISYIIENKKVAPGIFKPYVLQKFLYFIVFPARYLVPPPVRNYFKNESLIPKYTCPCCGYKTLSADPLEPNEICPICFWEYDPAQSKDPYYENGANGISLSQAQKNFLEYGVSDSRFRAAVRKPFYTDQKDQNWKLWS